MSSDTPIAFVFPHRN